MSTAWVTDPADRLAGTADANGVRPVERGVLGAGHINLPLTDIWPAA